MGIRQWPRGGLHVKGRKKKAKLCLAKNGNVGKTTFLQKKLWELQGTVPAGNNLLQSVEKYILQLETKVTILRCLSNLYGV
ncbi:hypothetical protein TSUD_201050 [Trifolium subterraneum]|uniref:Uncharacterized protein n=1 Tax=Trifolium subterraneum TaxID=3900 RepID=A0A2Z6LVD1_TRISU|nr:hypothetical protein TSUD_201050 [Trifolium subterraneum]